MKKLYLGLFAVLFAFNANAFDLAGAANKVAEGANNTTAAIEAKKAEAAEAKAAREKAAAERKAAREQAAADKKAELEKKLADKKAAAEKAKADREAAAAVKKAEREKAVEDAKNSLNNLKGAFSK